MTKNNIKIFVAEHIKDSDISYRGGSLKIDVSELFPNVSDPTMGAYQNYLGGGIAGAIVGGAMFSRDELETKKDLQLFDDVMEACKVLFYDINNGGGDDYMQEEVTGAQAGGYKKNQSMPVSGY